MEITLRRWTTAARHSSASAVPTVGYTTSIMNLSRSGPRRVRKGASISFLGVRSPFIREMIAATCSKQCLCLASLTHRVASHRLVWHHPTQGGRPEMVCCTLDIRSHFPVGRSHNRKLGNILADLSSQESTLPNNRLSSSQWYRDPDVSSLSRQRDKELRIGFKVGTRPPSATESRIARQQNGSKLI